ncbi:MAG: hypothetical protein AUH86_10610 [Acidobacteria bacterium 13_1_40CM_4_58_4]|nr:MAG: hypothetical protein AUH86_10610 [Acidobacteria bacterium 13_1_40CM_4_58_4]
MSTGLMRLVAAVLAITAPLFAGGALAADKPRGTAVDPAYQQAFEKWKAELVEDLKENWLPLAGLFWLKPDTNTFGTDPANDIVLPNRSAPARVGSFEFQGGDVTVNFLPDAHATIAGKPVTTAKLQPDTSGDRTVVELGGLRMHVIARGQRMGIRVKDLNSLAVRNYPGPVFFPLDPAYRITAMWVASGGKKTVDVPNVLGDVTPTPVAGEVRFKIDGQEVRLTDLGGDPSKGLFFVFSDLTSKKDTYPGGRFLQTDPVANGTVVLDFNRAYSPPCAVTPYATCPLAPKENRLSVAIPAGEKYERTHGHH